MRECHSRFYYKKKNNKSLLISFALEDVILHMLEASIVMLKLSAN
jgi:hypothetical protein